MPSLLSYLPEFETDQLSTLLIGVVIIVLVGIVAGVLFARFRSSSPTLPLESSTEGTVGGGPPEPHVGKSRMVEGCSVGCLIVLIGVVAFLVALTF